MTLHTGIHSIAKAAAILFFCLLLSVVKGQKIYVSPSGNDRNAGSKDRPVASFARAQQLARKFPSTVSVEVLFGRGIYYLPETIRFTAADAKSGGAHITYGAETAGEAILSGGSLLRLAWKPAGKGIFAAKVPANAVIDQLYINGIRQRMARFQNAIEGRNVFDTWSLDHSAVADALQDPLNPERVATWKDPAGAYLHAMHEYLWGDMHWLVKGKARADSLLYEGGWQNNRPSKMHGLYRMAENIFEELDQPGEWFFNRRESTLYYMPAPGTAMESAKVEIVRLKHLVEFNGSKDRPVTNIRISGFVFRHAARTFMENREPLLRSDWTVYRGGAVVFNGAEDCSITDAEFDQVGGNAIFVNNYNRRLSFSGCYIHHAGANGISFVGDPATVRNPIFRYGPQDYAHLDNQPGPRGDNFPEDCVVEDCLITMTGRDEKQTAPVQISMSHKIRVSHCSIYDVPRAGINISEGTFGGHIIEFCDVFNTVLETGDHGSFNSWGRDRYWTPDVQETSNQVAKNPSMPSWDMLEPNIIRNSRWRCDHGWDIDLDDGSSNYQITNNLLLNGGLKLREGFNRTVSNNIIVNNGFHIHVWYANSGDVITNNIVFKSYQPIGMDVAMAPDARWGKTLDRNFYVTGRDQMLAFAKNGCDINSLQGDPEFLQPSTGDFRVETSSPALATGFTNFPMDQFGVRKAWLRKIARTPEIPAVITNIQADAPKSAARQFSWMDIQLKEQSGNEMSAYGLGFDAAGVALPNIPAGSKAAKMGFRNGDLVLAINGSSTRTAKDLQANIEQSTGKGKTHRFSLVRNQQLMELVVAEELPPLAEDVVQSQWKGFERIDFTLGGRSCLLVKPKAAARNNPWIWRTEFFGHEPQGDSMLLEKGYHVAYIDVQNMYGAPVGLDHMDKLYGFLTAAYNLNKQVVLEGFSRGGLFAFNWAARHPDKVACIYGDAPVLDFKSWPGGKLSGPGSPGDWARLLQVYGLTEPEAMAYRLNPVDNLAPLARARIPLLFVCGDADKVVPLAENAALAEKRYRKLGATVKLISKPGVDHHPHSLADPTPIVDFILKYSLVK